MKKIVVATIATLIIAGCGSTSNESGAQLASAETTDRKNQVCEMSATTGSHLKKKKCMSKKMAKRIREQSQSVIREQARRQVSPIKNSQ